MSDMYSKFYKKLHVLEVEEVYDPSRFLFHEQAEVDAVENGAESKINKSDMYSKFP